LARKFELENSNVADLSFLVDIAEKIRSSTIFLTLELMRIDPTKLNEAAY